MNTTVSQIEQHPVMQAVLRDSFGGIMYNVANQGKYDATELLQLWHSLDASHQEACGGIIKGAINFLENK